MLNKTAVFFSITLIAALVMKWLHMQSDTNDLLFVLFPVQAFVKIALNTYSSYDASGFHFQELGIVIDKSCSGSNFLILSFCILSITIPYHRYSYIKASALFAIAMVLSYGITLIINLSRIMVSLELLRLKTTLPWITQPWVHETEGIFIYLSALLISHLTLKYYFFKNKNHDPKYSSSKVVALH